MLDGRMATPSTLPFPPIDALWRICSRRLLKTSWQTEKLLTMSNFSFCHDVFNSFRYYTFIFRKNSRCFQSRLLQICCMWEGVKSSAADVSKCSKTVKASQNIYATSREEVLENWQFRGVFSPNSQEVILPANHLSKDQHYRNSW